MKRVYCFFFGHDWGVLGPSRDKDIGAAALFLPITLFFIYTGVPQEADRTCSYCGKKETVNVK